MAREVCINPLDPNKRHYFSTIEVAEANSFFKRAVELRSVIHLWEKGHKEEQVEEFDVVDFSPTHQKLALDIKGGFFSRLGGSKLVNQEVFYKMNFSKIHLFSFGTLEFDTDSGLYFIHTGNVVYKSQQRSNYRLAANRHIRIWLKLNEIVYTGIDISASGMSVVAPLEQFEEGNFFDNGVIKLVSTTFNIPRVKVMRVTPLTDKFGRKGEEAQVGMLFENLDPLVEEELFKCINSEARAEEIRKNLSKKSK